MIATRPPHRVVPIGTQSGTWVLLITATLSAGVLIPATAPSVQGALILGIAAVILVPTLYRLLRGSFDPFEPTVAFMLAWGVMFVIRPIVALGSEPQVYERPTRVIDISSAFSEMLTMGLVGAIAFVVGYSAPPGRRLALRLGRPRDYFVDSAGFATLGLAAFGAGALALFVAQGGGISVVLSGRSEALDAALQSSSTYVWTAPYVLVPAALLLFMLWGRSRNPALLMAALAVTVLLLIRSVPVGSRMLLLPFVTTIPIAHYAATDRRPGLLRLLLLALLALFGSTLLLNARSTSSVEQGGLVDAAVGIMKEPSSIFHPIIRGPDTEESLTLAAALQVVPESIGHTWGTATVGDMLTRAVPREWWSGKPEIPRGKVIANLWPREYAPSGGSSANPEFSALLFWYMDFGWPGVVWGMAMYGFIFRVAYEYFRLHSTVTYVRLMYGLTFGFVIIALRDSPVDTAIRAVFMIAPLWFVLRLSQRGRSIGLEEPQ